MDTNDLRSLALQIGRLTEEVKRLDDLVAIVMPLVCERQEEADSRAYPRDPIRLKEAASLLGVQQSVLARWLKEGKLRFWKLPSGHMRVSRAEVLALPVSSSVDHQPPATPRRQSTQPTPKRERNQVRRFTRRTLARFGIDLEEEEGHATHP